MLHLSHAAPESPGVSSAAKAECGFEVEMTAGFAILSRLVLFQKLLFFLNACFFHLHN